MNTKALLLLATFSLLIGSCTTKDDSIDLIPIKAGDKWGYVDTKGQYVINAQFQDAFNFSEELALVQANDGKYGYIGKDGKYVINPIYKDAASFSEGLACVVMENGKPQFIDKQNKIIFTVDQADLCAGFKEGRARVKVKGKWGFIDRTGAMVISPVYEDVGPFSEGLARVAKKDEEKGEVLWGYVDTDGAVKINFQFMADKEMQYCAPTSFREGFAFVSSNGKEWGCIDKDGKYQVNPQFKGVIGNPYEFRNGLSVIAQGDNYGYIDAEGKYVINPQFMFARNFAANGLAAVRNSDEKWGFIDREGKYQINPQFDGVAFGYFGDIAFVESSDKWGIIDEKGRFVVNPQFDDVKLYDLEWSWPVQSDYVDNEGIATLLFDNSSRTAHLGYSKTTTLGDIIDDYPNVDVSNLELYELDIDTSNIDLGGVVEVTSMSFGFDEKTYTETPIYKMVRKYSYYYGVYYNEKEFDRMEKKVQTTAPINYVSYLMKLNKSGKGKGRSFAEALKKEAMAKMQVAQVGDLQVENTDAKGIFVLENDEVLVYIGYEQKEEENAKPTFRVTVVNNLYDDPFETLRNALVERFKSE